MQMTELDYELPQALIATQPAEPRDHSRLMVYAIGTGRVEHRSFFHLPEYLRATDLMVVNDTRVIPAKLVLRKGTGGVVSGLFLREVERGMWEVLLRTRGKADVGETLIAGEYRVKLMERLEQKGMWRVAVEPAEEAGRVLGAIGHVPLPPYIEKMRAGRAGDEAAEREHYQTVYAQEGQSVAAPTAGLHFTPGLLAKIEEMGVRRVAVNLEVGMGTFLPVETETLEAHPMHTERYAVPAGAVAVLREQRRGSGRVVVIGTTAVRTLEAAAGRILDERLPAEEIRETTALKISPGYGFRLTDVLVTNFHLPRSTLMALVGAKIGLERLKELYGVAIREGYRFYSYGDAMVILP